MSRISFFVLAVLFLPGVVVNAEPGFWEIESIDIPEAIKRNGKSIYQVIVLSAAPHRVIKKDGYADLLAREKDLLEGDMKRPVTESPEANLAMYYQVKSCTKSDEDVCQIYEMITVATAFEATLDSHRGDLWTSYRVVEALMRDNETKEAPLNIILVNREREVVLDTRFQGQSASIIDSSPELDVVRIRLSHAISKPLVFGASFGSGMWSLEDTFIAGYPLVQREETNREDIYAYPLSRYSLSVTIGEIFQDPQHSQDHTGGRHVVCDADSAPGMNGAPALNAGGEVIGVFIRPTKYKVGSILTPTAQILKHFLVRPERY